MNYAIVLIKMSIFDDKRAFFYYKIRKQFCNWNGKIRVCENNIAISFMKNDFLVANESLFYEIYENNFAIFLTGF